MRRFTFALLFVSASLVQAQNAAVELKVGQAKAGDKGKFTITQTIETTTALNVNGKTNNHTETVGSKFVYVETILEKPNPKLKATKLTRVYETAEVTTKTRTNPLFMQGKTIAIDFKDAHYTFTADGKPMEAKDSMVLTGEFADHRTANMREKLLPAGAVKVNDTWPLVPANILGKAGQYTFDNDKSKSSGKLLKVYDKDGRQYGVIEVKADLKVTETKVTGAKMEPAKDGSSIDMTLTLDITIDGGTPYGTFKSVTVSDIGVERTSKSSRQVKTTDTSEASVVPVK